MATAGEISLILKMQDQASRQMAAIRQELRGLAPAAQQAERGVGGLVTGLSKIGLASVGIGALVNAAQKLAGVLADPIQKASDLNESVNKAGVVFGQSAAKVQAFAQTSVASLGTTQQAAIEATSTFGNLFTSLGIGRAPAADMSTRMVQLAADLASFNNTAGGTSQVLADLQSGIVGETEPLRKYGIVLLESVVAQEAVRLGLAKSAAQVSETAKAQARFSLIMQQSANAQGDFARTSGDTANAQRILGAGFQELITRIGQQFLPGWKEVVGALAKDLPGLIPTVVQAIQPLADAFVDLAKRVAEFVRSGGLRAWVADIGAQVTFALRALGILASGFQSAFESILRIVLSVGTLILEAFGLINPWVRHSPSLVEQVDTGFAHIGDSARDLAGTIIPALQTAGAAMSALGAAAANGLARASDIATAALVKNLSVLGPGVAAAYQQAKAALDAYTEAMKAVAEQIAAQQAEIDEMNRALKEQERILAGMEGALKPLEKAYQAARQHTADLKDQIEEANRAIEDLANTALPGENAASQKVFGLEHAKDILELQRARLIESGVSEKDPRVKALDEQIKRHEEAIRIARLEQKVNFDGQRNEIEQAKKAAGYAETTKEAILKGIGEQIAKRAALQTALDAAKTAEEAAKGAVDQQTEAIEKQKAVIEAARDAIQQKKDKLDELQAVYDKLKQGAEEWKAQLDEVERAASAINQALAAAAKASAAAGAALPKVPPLETPSFLTPGMDAGEQNRADLERFGQVAKQASPVEARLAALQKLVDDFKGGLKDLADKLSGVAGTGKTAAEAFERLQGAFKAINEAPDNPKGSALHQLIEDFNTLKELATDVSNVLSGKPLVPHDVVAPRAKPGQPDESREQKDYQPIVMRVKELYDAWKVVADWWNTGDGKTWRESLKTFLDSDFGRWAVKAIGFISKPGESMLVAWQEVFAWWKGDGNTLRKEYEAFLGSDFGQWASKAIAVLRDPTGSLVAAWQEVFAWWKGDGNTWREAINGFFTSDFVKWVGVAAGLLSGKTDSYLTAWSALTAWWDGDGKTWRDGIATWFNTTLDGLVKTGNGFVASFGRAWTDVQTAAQGLLDFFAGVFKTGFEALTKPDGVLGRLKSWWDGLLEIFRELTRLWEALLGKKKPDVPSVPAGGGMTADLSSGLSLSALTQAAGPATRSVNAPIVINNTIDARGMTTTQLTQAAGGDLATLSRRRVLSGAL